MFPNLVYNVAFVLFFASILFCFETSQSRLSKQSCENLSLQEVLPNDVNVWQDHSFLPHQAEAELLKTKQFGELFSCFFVIISCLTTLVVVSKHFIYVQRPN